MSRWGGGGQGIREIAYGGKNRVVLLVCVDLLGCSDVAEIDAASLSAG